MTAITLELDVNDFDFADELDLIEQVAAEVGEFASGIGAEVDVEVQSVEFTHDTVTVSVSGHYIEVGLFNRRWFDGE